MAIGRAEAAQVGHDEVGLACQPSGHLAVVAPRSRPAVQGDDRRAAARAVVGEPEAVDRSPARHGRQDIPGDRASRAAPISSSTIPPDCGRPGRRAWRTSRSCGSRRPTARSSRWLYAEVGRAYRWTDHLARSDAEWQAWADSVETWVASVGASARRLLRAERGRGRRRGGLLRAAAAPSTGRAWAASCSPTPCAAPSSWPRACGCTRAPSTGPRRCRTTGRAACARFGRRRCEGGAACRPRPRAVRSSTPPCGERGAGGPS